MSTARRRRGGAQRGADAVMGWLIPFAFIVLAGYQQVTEGKIDKYVIGVLLIFGLGALGWRIDLIAETYVKAKYAVPAPGARKVREDDNNGDE